MMCSICHEPIGMTFWGPRGTGGVCRYDEDPNQDNQGQHVAVHILYVTPGRTSDELVNAAKDLGWVIVMEEGIANG